MFIFNIKNIREDKNISINRLNKLTGISRAYLFDLENNRKFNPTLAMLEKIAEALDVNIKELFYSIRDVEDLKEEMYHRIEVFGLDSKEVYEISQIIDLLLNVDGTFK